MLWFKMSLPVAIPDSCFAKGVPTRETGLEMREMMGLKKRERIYGFEIVKELRDGCKRVRQERSGTVFG